MGMDVTQAAVVRVPEQNVRIPLEEFADVWRHAEGLHDALVAEPMDRAALAAIVWVCRWLAGAHPRSPVTGRTVRACPAEIEAELNIMMGAFQLNPVPAWLIEPPGWSTGLAFALAWAWLGGEMPLIHHVNDEVVRVPPPR